MAEVNALLNLPYSHSQIQSALFEFKMIPGFIVIGMYMHAQETLCLIIRLDILISILILS